MQRKYFKVRSLPQGAISKAFFVMEELDTETEC